MPVSTDITLSAPYILVQQESAPEGSIVSHPTGQQNVSYAYVKQINATTTAYAENDLIMFKQSATARVLYIADVQYSLIEESDVILKETIPVT